METDTRERYLAGFVSEAQLDAVAFGHIVQVGGWLRLSGVELDGFVRQAVVALLESGAEVVVPFAPPLHGWETYPRCLGLSRAETVEALFQDWKTIDDGYGYFAWFAKRNESYRSG